MIEKETIDALLVAGSKAPSGDNSQPWFFSNTENTINVFMLPDKDNAFLNFKQSGTLMANGAVIENVVIKATQFGLITHVRLFPDSNNRNHVAEIQLTKGEVGMNKLCEYINKRETNRKKYSNDQIPESVLAELLLLVNPEDRVTLKILTGSSMKILGHAGSRAEIAILENEELHQLLFKNIVWTKSEEGEKKEGLFVKTLELLPPQELMFRLCRNWKVMRVLNKIGFAKFIANDDAKKYSTGGAYVAIVAEAFDDETCVISGRIMQRAWIFLNSKNLSVHPISATLFFGHRISQKREEGLTKDTWESMTTAFKQILKEVEVTKNQHIMFMMRVGKSSSPSAHSSKKAPSLKANESNDFTTPTTVVQ